MPPMGERFEMRLDSDLANRIDAWRSKESGFPSRAEAIRKLVDTGLGKEQDKSLFQIARFNVLCAAKMKETESSLSDAYVYAWSEGIYPASQASSGLHKSFADCFDVPPERVDELLNLLDKDWRSKKVRSFYDLEDHYNIRSGIGFWDRIRLIHTCRYFYLDDLFDKDFWKSLLAGGDHPSEAASITRKLERDFDIYLN